MYKYISIITFFLCFISCAESTTDFKATSDYRLKSYKTTSGSSCGEDCIWSRYAITSGVQNPEKMCENGECACVVEGNIYSLCNNKYTEDISYDHDILQEENSAELFLDVPYYNQYNNINYPSSTCQNTSIAMVLSYFESNIIPDSIFYKWGKDYAQSPYGLNAVYTSYSSKSKISTYTSASPEDLISALNSGYIAIVHGYFTSYGHVIVVRGYDGENYYVNDPAGKWPECFKCGYSNASFNGVTSYSKNSFESAVFTSDGYSYLPGWIHLIK
tara:strand:- start:847 stop:1665 length:819 start_codon:yes stop_codon:yes gene_type:complete